MLKVLFALASLFAYESSAATLPGERFPYLFHPGQGVLTTSGLVSGRAASKLTDVSEYLGIRYAKPPVGSLRFAAPERFLGFGKVDATSYSPDCPANLNPSATTSLASNASYALLADISQQGNPMSEDCLSLNIWTKPQAGEGKKAVLLWVHGGGWQTGSTRDSQINGQYFAGNQDVVVVTINYRVNIFGFPGLPGMDQNVGLLDIRAAIEWVHDNIAQFGGDPDRITLFGQSAGAASIDLYSFAYPNDTLVNAFIEESGTATSFYFPYPLNNTQSWYDTIAQLNCGDSSTPFPTTVDCMRGQPYQAILNASKTTGIAAIQGNFAPTIDNKTVFGDYQQRARNGQFLSRPSLIGNNDYEAGLFKLIAAGANVSLPDDANARWSIFNQAVFSCTAYAGAGARTANASTYRYRYFGDYPNNKLTSSPDSGAWHGAEIPVIWGTTQDVTGVAPTPVEALVSESLNDAWASFAKDPENALSAPPFSWPKFDPNEGATTIRLGYGNETEASFIGLTDYDPACKPLGKVWASLANQSILALLFETPETLAPLLQFQNITALGGGSEVGY